MPLYSGMAGRRLEDTPEEVIVGLRADGQEVKSERKSKGPAAERRHVFEGLSGDHMDGCSRSKGGPGWTGPFASQETENAIQICLSEKVVIGSHNWKISRWRVCMKHVF